MSETRTAPAVTPELIDFFKAHPRLALAFSGGTDSAYLLYAALACGCDVRAYYARSPFQPAFELEDARRLAGQLNAEMRVIPLDVLADETVRSNPPDRCYHCKRRIFSSLLEVAAEDGFDTVIDGTNASDDAGDRPGMRALRELRVLSPSGCAASPRTGCALFPARPGFSPGTSPPTPAWRPACPPERRSPRHCSSGWSAPRPRCSICALPISACACFTMPPGCSCPRNSSPGPWSGAGTSARH